MDWRRSDTATQMAATSPVEPITTRREVRAIGDLEKKGSVTGDAGSPSAWLSYETRCGGGAISGGPMRYVSVTGGGSAPSAW